MDDSHHLLDALDDGVGVARVLTAHQLAALAMALIEARIIEKHVAADAADKLGPPLLPELAGGESGWLSENTVPYRAANQSDAQPGKCPCTFPGY